MDSKVIIIGAGMAGLSAGKILSAYNIPFEILEARDRTGGRIYTQYDEEAGILELGGQWIGPTQDEMYQLLEDFNLEVFPTYTEGKNLIAFNNRILQYSGLIPKVSIPVLLNIDFVIKDLNRNAMGIDIHQPWFHPKANWWDSITLQQYLHKKVWLSTALEILQAGLETVFGVNPSEISLLQVLFYIKSGKDLNVLFNIEGGAQQHRIKGGMGAVVDGIAKSFSSSIHLNHAVRSILKSGEGYQVNSDKVAFNCQRIILAIPPTLWSSIQFEPDLPTLKFQVMQRMPMGTVIKYYAMYKEPFWRKEGLSGIAVTDPTFPFQTVFDNTEPGAQGGKLMAFSIANRARALQIFDPEKRKETIIKHLATLFGDQANFPTHFVEQCWSTERWSRGCYAGMKTTGAWTAFKDILSQKVGGIHFAGTETSPIWNGYIEGAILSGKRAALEVVNSL
ncbi:MAG TPA: FAD-dependent oxidoreductase [Saprospiraceae bacterium]|nr:FAD-dependent oxidoreductase [Saprospiraceae bacterium]